VTDDTQLAITLARSLNQHQRLDPDDLGRRYLAWSQTAFDIGNLTRASLGRIAAGTPAAEAGLAQWVHSGHTASGNGSLMRTAPIGVFFAQDAQARRQASLSESAITHADPRCQLACAAFNAAIARALQSGGPGQPMDLTEAMTVAAERELPQAAQQLNDLLPGHGDRVQEALADLRSDLAMARADDPELYHGASHGLDLQTQSGFVRVAFRLAFWELRHAPSFKAALVDVVNRGGDADTNGAIAGALLGARHGRAAIPAAWLRAVEQGRNRMGAAYHPAWFETFAGQLP
jgi:ADP-ribosylglycohydrolase